MTVKKLFKLAVGEEYTAYLNEDDCIWFVTDDYGYEISFFDYKIILKEV